MIFEITNNISSLPEQKYREFARVLSDALARNHYISFHYQACRWFEEKILFTDLYYGALEQEELSKIILQSPPTSISSHVSKFTVGTEPERDLASMVVLVRNESQIVVENNLFDGAAIGKWIRLYRNERNYKTINQLVHRQMSSSLIRFSNGGGKDNIPNDIAYHIQEYKGYHSYKLFSVFDSDKARKEDSDKNVHVKRELNAKGISWHELENREIENYFPLSTYQNSGLISTEPITIGLAEDWDYQNLYELKGLQFEKKDVLTLSDHLTKDELKSRFEHKSSNPDEIQTLILKIANIA